MNLPIVDLPRGGAPVPVPAPQAIVDLALPSYATTFDPLDVEPIQRFISSRLPRSRSTLSGLTLFSLKQTHNTTRLVLLDEHAVVVNVGQPLAFDSCEIQRSSENPYPVVNTSNLQIGVAVEPPQPPPSVAGAGELDDDDIDVANPQGGSGDDGMMPGLVDSFP